MTIYRRISILVACIIGVISGAAAASLDEAKALYRAERYADALPIFKSYLSQKPADGSLNHWTGVCLLKTGQLTAAKPLLLTAVKKKVTEASRYLAEMAFLDYDVDAADSYIEDYKAALKRSKTKMPADAEQLVDRIDRMRSMLDRVEKIVIVDSVNVDRKEFFAAYRLSPESGSLYSPSELPEDFASTTASVVYSPQDHASMMWSMSDENGHAALVESSALGDGTWETPHSIGSAVNNGGNADYPFVMSDGVTLYYASDGEGSLGGYDIFISRREDNEFLAPQNVGMPYNSPYNDYLLAIDEVTGMGWWATDRNGIDGQVTIYKFIPSELRVNYDVDEPRLASYAKVASIRDTWAAGADYSAILNAVDGITTDAHTEAHDFELGFADGRRYTKWDDFHNAAARRKMEQYVDAREAFDEQSVELAGLRERYAGGDHSVQNRIMELEKHQLSDRTALRNILNEVFRLEQ